jgi:hypothetical protein
MILGNVAAQNEPAISRIVPCDTRNGGGGIQSAKVNSKEATEGPHADWLDSARYNSSSEPSSRPSAVGALPTTATNKEVSNTPTVKQPKPAQPAILPPSETTTG